MEAAYKTLGLDKTSKPTVKQIHDTYHSLARENHPDKNLLTSAEATSKFQAIQSAYTAILTDFTLHGDDAAPSTNGKEDSKLVKPWAARKGRRFNHRAMGEVENLKKNAARAAAQRALDDILGLEAGERPKEKARAKEWDRRKRMKEDAEARERAEKQNVELEQARRIEFRRRKEASKLVSRGRVEDEGALVHVKVDEDWKKAVTVIGPPGSKPLKPRIVIGRSTGGNIVANKMVEEETAKLDAESAKLQAEEDLKFVIPKELEDPSSFQNLKAPLSSEELEKAASLEKAERDKATAVEGFWSTRAASTSISNTIIPKREKPLDSTVEEAARAYTQALLTNPALDTTSAHPLPDVVQDRLQRGKWKGTPAPHDESALMEFIGDREQVQDGMESWELIMETKFNLDHEKQEETNRAWDNRRREALIQALEYESGKLLKE